MPQKNARLKSCSRAATPSLLALAVLAGKDCWLTETVLRLKISVLKTVGATHSK